MDLPQSLLSIPCKLDCIEVHNDLVHRSNPTRKKYLKSKGFGYSKKLIEKTVFQSFLQSFLPDKLPVFYYRLIMA